MKHLEEFIIHSFRGMRDLRLEELGQVNLLVGGNNSGKTSVLEALALFCDPFNTRTWLDAASLRDMRESMMGLWVRGLLDRLIWLFPQNEESKSPTTPEIALTGFGNIPHTQDLTDSNLSQNLFDLLNDMRIDIQQIRAFGLIVDADNNSPDEVAQEYADKFRKFFPAISVTPGKVVANDSRTGIFVLPDNSRPGTLDTFLIDCASVAYPDHKSGAMQFLSDLDETHKSHWKPFDFEKAVVATIVSVVQPGMGNTSSIRRDQWISEQTLSNLTQVARLSAFLRNLLELPQTESMLQNV